VYQTQLKARLQKTGENLQEFEADIRRLVHLAYLAVPDEIQEEFVAQYFVEGIRDPEVKKMLKIFKGSNSSKLMVRALEVDTKDTIAGIAGSGLVLQTRSADEIRTSEQITGTPLLKETFRVIIVDVKDITAGIADSSLVCRPRRTGVTRSRK